LDRVVRIVAAALGRRARFADRRALCAGIPCAARAGRRDRAVRIRDRLPVARARARGHRPLRGRARRSAREGRRAMTARRRDPSKALLDGFLTLLVVLVIQVAWWVTDHVSYTSAVERRIEALYSADATVVGELLRGRVPPALDTLMPHLDIGSSDARVKPDALAELARDTAARKNRYIWEGAFFLVVLIGGMGVLSRAILHDRELRRRQQNFLA